MRDTLTNYIGLTQQIENAISNPALSITLAALTAAVFAAWEIRYVIKTILHHPYWTTALPSHEFYQQISDLGIFKESFLNIIVHQDSNPFNQTILERLRAELAFGDSILYDVGVHSALGDLEPAIQFVQSELLLILPLI